MCLSLNDEFKTEGFTFEPAPITDLLQLHVTLLRRHAHHPPDRREKWPFVPEDVTTAWKDVPTTILSKYDATDPAIRILLRGRA